MMTQAHWRSQRAVALHRPEAQCRHIVDHAPPGQLRAPGNTLLTHHPLSACAVRAVVLTWPRKHPASCAHPAALLAHRSLSTCVLCRLLSHPGQGRPPARVTTQARRWSQRTKPCAQHGVNMTQSTQNITPAARAQRRKSCRACRRVSVHTIPGTKHPWRRRCSQMPIHK